MDTRHRHPDVDLPDDLPQPRSAPDSPPTSRRTSSGRPPRRESDGLPTVLMAMTVLSGVIDAVSYLGLGRLFLGKMTGNVVVVGFSVANVPGFILQTAVPALVAFLAGAAAAGRLCGSLGHRRARWVATALAIEAGLLLVAVAGAYLLDTDSPNADTLWLIALLALAMGFRNATARKLAIPDMTTTLITLTLADIAADSFVAGGRNPRLVRRIGVVLSTFAGAAVGGALLTYHGLVAPLALAACLATALAAGYPTFVLYKRNSVRRANGGPLTSASR